MNADGSGLRRLTRNAAADGQAVWSPDGRKIAFVRFRHGDSEIHVMNADGSGQRKLTRTPGARRLSGLVTRRAEDRVRRQAQGRVGGLQHRHLRHERRRERAAEPDAAQSLTRRVGARSSAARSQRAVEWKSPASGAFL